MSKKYNKKHHATQRVVVPNTLIDVCIPAYNRFDIFSRCLDALPIAMGELTYRVIIFDNGSEKNDADVFYANENFREYTIIRNPQNLGFPKACNLSVRKGNSPLIFLLNTDVILDPNSVEKMVKDMDYPDIGVVGMLLTFPDRLDGLNSQIRPVGKVQHVGLATNVHGDIIHPLIGWSVDNPKVQRVRKVVGVTGAAFLTRRNLWTKFGGFDEAYGIGTYEEVDFCMKVTEAGYSIIVETEARGTHHTGATAEKYQIPYPLHQNKFLFMNKWMAKLTYTEWQIW